MLAFNPTPLTNPDLTTACQALRLRWPLLTEREQQLTYVLALGYTNQEIATLLSIQEQTVRTHLTHVYTKLKINTRHLLIAAMWSTSLAHTHQLVCTFNQYKLVQLIHNGA